MDNDKIREQYGHYARRLTESEVEKLANDTVRLSPFKCNKLELEARKHWDLFYKRNETRFFKDRHWTKREFEELICDTQSDNSRPVLLEVGCGVGNFIVPLIEENCAFYIYACDFSPRAVEFVQSNPLFTEDVGKAFQCDITQDRLSDTIPEGSVDIATMIFVLSAVHPDKMGQSLENVLKVLRPGGLLLFRDYGLYDQAMLRFGPGHKIGENFYVRQDGTRAFYFSEEHLMELFVQAGYLVESSSYVTRETVNKKEGICVPRIFVQGKFRRPS
ncbi:tRNA N(3)-methylcytidine methyltransferase METTL6-like [Ornithodoros turicata]|uniref:tRNA N(3)-methylcytidine methyltransferase METTL6-like n=1 Tax=Ornithodoros turicata TaxID=34597 RepID=UPI0031396720